MKTIVALWQRIIFNLKLMFENSELNELQLFLCLCIVIISV